jgi:outer membrane protein OmpA-like peptidoglycan-associated protein
MLVNNYPDYRVAIRGHTGKGDEKANLKLSSERADIVRSRLIAVHGVDPNRLLSEGLGDKQAPIQKTGENIRAFSLRWARVEFVLLQ